MNGDSLQTDFAEFQQLMRSTVEDLERRMPKEYLRQAWVVQCYHSQREFAAEFPDALERRRMLTEIAEVRDYVEHVRDEVGSSLQALVDHGARGDDNEGETNFS